MALCLGEPWPRKSTATKFLGVTNCLVRQKIECADAQPRNWLFIRVQLSVCIIQYQGAGIGKFALGRNRQAHTQPSQPASDALATGIWPSGQLLI